MASRNASTPWNEPSARSAASTAATRCEERMMGRPRPDTCRASARTNVLKRESKGAMRALDVQATLVTDGLPANSRLRRAAHLASVWMLVGSTPRERVWP
eukprot:scaffold187090_cov37-Tisochrysis_lutea.AAC.2